VQELVELVSSKVLHELPEDDSFGIKTRNIVKCRSRNRVVFELCCFCFYTKILLFQLFFYILWLSL